MLTGKQLNEIREHLEKAQNPLFFYDNDADGLCSYILLRKFIGRGKGVAVRSHPDVDVQYVRKVYELNADYIFVLDRPFLGKSFVEEISKLNLPIVWIDHHTTDEKYDYDNLFVYNPMKGSKKSDEPVTYWSYKVTGRVEDSWLAVMGCIADRYMPNFAQGLEKQYPEMWRKLKDPFDAYFGTELGKLARSLGFGLKDSITNVIYLQNFLISVTSPVDLLAELDSSSSFANKYKTIRKKYDLLIADSKKHVEDKMVFFSYGGDLSISSELSNELSYIYPKKYIIVAYINGPTSNVSMRGKGVRKILEKLLPSFERASGGGHEDAVGARLQTGDLERFKSGIEKEI